MKLFILVIFLILVSCVHKTQNKAAENIEKYIKQKFSSADSIKSISINSLIKDWHQTPLDSDIVAWSYAHNKSKFDNRAREMCIDSMNKIRPDLTERNIKILKLIESGKLDFYWTNCSFTVAQKGEKKALRYFFELDTNYMVTNGKDISDEKLIGE